MTDNTLAQQQYSGSNSGFTSHGMPPYNGITSGPTSGDQLAPNSARSGPPMDYPHQPPNSMYYGGPGQPSANIRGPTGVGYPKMSPGRPGWPAMPPSQPRGYPSGSSMSGQHHGGSVPTPTLNQLLQQGTSGPEVRHPPMYPGAEFGGGPQKMTGEEYGPGPAGFGVPHPNWSGGPQRMGPGPPHPSQMTGGPNMETMRYDGSRRPNVQSGMGGVRFMPNQLGEMHGMPQYAPSPMQQQQPPSSSGQAPPQVQPSPSTTPLSQHSDQASSVHSSPPQHPPQKSKSKKNGSRQPPPVIQESSEEVNAAEAASRQAAMVSRPPSAAGAQTLPRPGSAYGSLPPAPSPAGSVGSRSNTPASLSGTMIGSPSGSMHDVQNRIMSPVHGQGGHQFQQHMMPPPTMFPGPGPGGNTGKMYPSGMMMHPGGNVGMPQSSGIYPGQPYGGPPHQGGYGPAPGYCGHPGDMYGGPSMGGPPSQQYRGMNYPAGYPSSSSSMEQHQPGQFAAAAAAASNASGPGNSGSGESVGMQPGSLGGRAGSTTSEDGSAAQAVQSSEHVGMHGQQGSGSDGVKDTSTAASMDGNHVRPAGAPGGDDNLVRQHPGMDNRPGYPPDGTNMRYGQSGMDVRAGPQKQMFGQMSSRSAPFMNMNGVAIRPGQMPFGPGGAQDRGMEGMAAGPQGDDMDSMASRHEQPGMGHDQLLRRAGQSVPVDGMFSRQGPPPMGMDGPGGRLGAPGMDAMLRRTNAMPDDGSMNRPALNSNMDARASIHSMPARGDEASDDAFRHGPQMAPGSMPVRPGMESMPGRPLPPHMGGGMAEGVNIRPMPPQHAPGGMDMMPGRLGQMRMEAMERRGGMPEGMGSGPHSQHPSYSQQYQGYGSHPPPNHPHGPPPAGYSGPESAGPGEQMFVNHMPPHGMHSDNRGPPPGPGSGTDGYRSGGEFTGDQRHYMPNGDVDMIRRTGDPSFVPKNFENDANLESGARLRKSDDGCPDFMSTPGGAAGRMDGMPGKPMPAWDADEAARIKSSMMSRDKMDGMFHPPMMSGSGRVPPSPATSAHEEHDSASNLSWPSTPKSGHNDVLNRLADMGDEPDRRKMLERLFAFMEERGTPIVAVPTISKIAVDLFRLYHIVKDFGGMVEVTKNKKWRDVSSTLGLGPSSSAGFTLKKNYGKHLFPFECRFDRGNIDPAPLLAFLEQPSKKESKKAAAERAAATAAASAHDTYRAQFPNAPGYQHGSAPGPPGDPMMMQTQYGPSAGMGPNAGPMMRHGMPLPASGDGSVSIQNPFSDGLGSGSYPRPGYGMPPGGPYEGRSGQFHGRPPPEGFDGPYGGQDGGAYPGRPLPDVPGSRYEQGPPGSFNYPGSQSRLDKYGPGPYSVGQGPMKPGVRPYFPDHADSYGTPYGTHRGQQWVPPGSCSPNYPPHYSSQVMSEQYRLGSGVPPYGHSMGPCISPHTRPDHCNIPIQRMPSVYAARRELLFPADSVEATRPNLTKLKRLTHRHVGPVDAWRMMMALKSGVVAESTWALDILSILLRDESAVLWFGLHQMPGLVDVLLEHFRRCLIEIFPGDFDELEITLESAASLEGKTLNNSCTTDESSDTSKTEQSDETAVKSAENCEVMDSQAARTSFEGSALVDEKLWDVYGEIDSSLLDWQMGRGDTSTHVQTHFHEMASICFAHQRYFGRHSKHAVSSVIAQHRQLDRFEAHPTATSTKPAVITRVGSDDKLPVLCAAEPDVKKEPAEATEMMDTDNQLATKAEPPDIVRDVVDAKVEPKTEDVNSSSPADEPPVPALCDDRGLESLKRKWTEELEEDSEAYERDLQSLFVVSEARTEVQRRCLGVSNVLRGLSFVPYNDCELSRHPGLLAALGRLLLLGHRHPREPRRRLPRGSEDDDVPVVDDETPIKSAVYDGWRWDTVGVLREDTLAIFANIAGQLDLAAFPEEICIPVLDGLLHWASCSAACALDPMPSTPNASGPSPRRLALEALCKLCVTDANVDLLLATPPFKRIVCLLDDLVNILSDVMSDQVAREFAVVLASSLAAADASAARAIALRRSSVSAFLGFIEVADRQAQQLVQAQGVAMLRDNPEMMGTSVDMLRRAASVVRAIAETADSRASLFADHQQRLLQLSMSPTLDSAVTVTIADVLFLCSQAQ